MGSVLDMLSRVEFVPRFLHSESELNGINPVLVPGVGHISRQPRRLVALDSVSH